MLEQVHGTLGGCGEIAPSTWGLREACWQQCLLEMHLRQQHANLQYRNITKRWKKQNWQTFSKIDYENHSFWRWTFKLCDCVPFLLLSLLKLKCYGKTNKKYIGHVIIRCANLSWTYFQMLFLWPERDFSQAIIPAPPSTTTDLLLTGADTENGKIQGQDCLERERKYIHALCRINFNFMWVKQQQHSFPRCVYKHKCVNECLWGIGIFPQHKHCTLTAHEQRFRKMCVLVLVLPLHHRVLENTVKLSKLQSPPLYNLSLDHTSSISSPNPNLLSYFIRIPAVFFSYCFLPLRCKDAITLRVNYFFLN